MTYEFVESVELEGRIVGKIVRLDGKLTYVSPRKSRHFFIKFNGFGVEREILYKLLDKGVSIVLIDYQGLRNNIIFKSNIDDWILKGIDWTDRGAQKILSKKHMVEYIQPSI